MDEVEKFAAAVAAAKDAVGKETIERVLKEAAEKAKQEEELEAQARAKKAALEEQAKQEEMKKDAPQIDIEVAFEAALKEVKDRLRPKEGDNNAPEVRRAIIVQDNGKGAETDGAPNTGMLPPKEIQK